MAMTLFLKPADGLNVNDPAFMGSPPALRHLPAEGRLVQHSLYWVKCIRRGEVIECDPDTHEPLEKAIDPISAKADGAGGDTEL